MSSLKSKEIDWQNVLLNLWESDDIYQNRFTRIEIKKNNSCPYEVTCKRSGHKSHFSSHNLAIEWLEILRKADWEERV
jgi:hypothetical protein